MPVEDERMIVPRPVRTRALVIEIALVVVLTIVSIGAWDSLETWVGIGIVLLVALVIVREVR